MAWRKARDEYWNREQIRQMNEEKFAQRAKYDPTTADEFREQETFDRQRQQRAQQHEAEEAWQDQQRAREEQDRQRRQAARASLAPEAYMNYWEAYASGDSQGQVKALVAYAIAAGLADGHSGSGFATQRAADATVASLKDIANCPANFRAKYRAIRSVTMPELQLPELPELPEPESSPQRLATARQQLLGDGIAALTNQ